MGFHSHPSCRSSIALSSGDSYRELFAAAAAIQLIIKAWLNSHIFCFKLFSWRVFVVFVWDLVFVFKAIIKITWEGSTQGPQ